MALIDPSSYLDNPVLSDVDVVIIIKGQQQPASQSSQSSRKRTREAAPSIAATLPSHRVLLHMWSPRWAAELEQWQAHAAAAQQAGASGAPSSARQPSRPRIEWEVDAKDVGAAKVLFRSLYKGSKALEGASQQLLLAVLRLADRFKVQHCAAAAGQLLAAIPPEQLEWPTVHSIFEECLQAPPFASLSAACCKKLQNELGDLDSAMGSEGQKQQLLLLPLSALVALLKDARTRASCEDTVLAVVTAWWRERWPRGAQNHANQQRKQQAQQLAAVVRFGRLSPVVLATVATRTDWVQLVVTTSDFYQLVAFAAGPVAYQDGRLNDEDGIVSDHPGWLLPERPLSLVTEASWVVEVTVEQLKAATEQLLGGGAGCSSGSRGGSSRGASGGSGSDIGGSGGSGNGSSRGGGGGSCSSRGPRGGSGSGGSSSGSGGGSSTAASECAIPYESQFFQGFTWRLEVYVTLSDCGRGVKYGMWMRIVDRGWFNVQPDQRIPCHLRLSTVSKNCALKPSRGQRRPAGIVVESDKATPVGGWVGSVDFWELGMQESWSVEAWERKGLVLEGGKVRVEVQLRKHGELIDRPARAVGGQ